MTSHPDVVGGQSVVPLPKDSQARTVIRDLLDGSAPDGTTPEQCGPWAEIVAGLYAAHEAGGTQQVRATFNALAKANPSVARLVSEQPRPQATTELEGQPESKAPPLPQYAQLTTDQEAEAQLAGSWVDDYTAFASKASPLTPVSFHIAAALFALGLAIARRLYVAVSTSTNWIWSNLYLLFVGPSTRPRKTTAMRVLRGLIETAGIEWLLLADRQTPEALALDLTLRVPQGFDSWSFEQQATWLKERGFAAQRGWLLEESSHLLDSFNRDYSSGLLPMVLDLYDSSDTGPTRNTIKRGRERIEKPYLSIFGTSTYGAMAEHVQNQVHWHNGLWARIALITSDTSGEWQFWPPSLDYPSDLVERLMSITFDLLPMPKARLETQEVLDEFTGKSKKVKVVVIDSRLISSEVQVQNEARDQWEKYSRAVTYDMLPDGGEGPVPARFYASYGRLGTMLIKVAMLLATADADRLPVVIEARHVYRAQIVVESWRENLHGVMDRVRRASKADRADDLGRKLLSFLAQHGREWTTRRDLLRKLGTRWSVTEAIIGDLEQSGEIERRSYKPPRGSASEEYRICVPDVDPKAE